MLSYFRGKSLLLEIQIEIKLFFFIALQVQYLIFKITINISVVFAIRTKEKQIKIPRNIHIRMSLIQMYQTESLENSETSAINEQIVFDILCNHLLMQKSLSQP